MADVKRRDASDEGEDLIRDGNVVFEERMNRREGLVEFVDNSAEGTTGAAGSTGEGAASVPAGEVHSSPAMQAGATILGGLGNTAMVDDAATASGSLGASGDPLSMSTDNTTVGRSMGDTVEGGPISQVREGMRVVDANGEEIGKVGDVKMGDPSAVTTAGQGMGAGADDAAIVAPVGSGSTGGGGGLANVGAGFFGGGGLDLPEQMRNELLRVGYVKVDGKGWFDHDHYARADQIGDVANDTVRLSVGKDGLVTP